MSSEHHTEVYAETFMGLVTGWGWQCCTCGADGRDLLDEAAAEAAADAHTPTDGTPVPDRPEQVA